MSADVTSRARGAMVGLAIGDAAGFPALYHRTAKIPRRRQSLWDFAADLDRHHVLRFPLPFTNGRPEPLYVAATDDAEYAAVAATMLLECGEDHSPDALFAAWQKHVVDADSTVWCGIAEKSSILNSRRGMRPPHTGNDNPAHFYDGAVARAVPVGIRYRGDATRAAEIAASLAQITHAEDGVWAAEAMAAAIASLVAGGNLDEAITAGRSRIPADSWLGRQVHTALDLATTAPSPVDLAAELSDKVANSSYTAGTIAPETLASAFAITVAAGGDPGSAIPAATMVAKQADSMPAMVGALTGAAAGLEALPGAWARRVCTLKGICVPSVEGVSLLDIADALREAA